MRPGRPRLIRGESVGVVEFVDVIDCPTTEVILNNMQRPRLCVEELVELVRELSVPRGTIVYLKEGGATNMFSPQSAFVQGSCFGIWKGVLVSAGRDVRVVKPQTCKWALGLTKRGVRSDKDSSRKSAKKLFPEVGDERLKRVKDHGRAEALLIAAHGHSAIPGARDPLSNRVRCALSDGCQM